MHEKFRFLLIFLGLFATQNLSAQNSMSTSSSASTSEDVDDIEALGDYCPRFKKNKETKEFFRSMAHNRTDFTNTRKVFIYKNLVWYVEPIYAENLEENSVYKSIKFRNFQIIIDAEARVKLRCYYFAKLKSSDKKDSAKFHITTFF